MPASNTQDCFREFVGLRVKGVMFNALPVGRADLSDGTKTIVFEDGRALTIASNGAYWVDSVSDVQRAIALVESELRATQRGLKEVLALAGSTQQHSGNPKP